MFPFLTKLSLIFAVADWRTPICCDFSNSLFLLRGIDWEVAKMLIHHLYLFRLIYIHRFCLSVMTEFLVTPSVLGHSEHSDFLSRAKSCLSDDKIPFINLHVWFISRFRFTFAAVLVNTCYISSPLKRNWFDTSSMLEVFHFYAQVKTLKINLPISMQDTAQRLFRQRTMNSKTCKYWMLLHPYSASARAWLMERSLSRVYHAQVWTWSTPS